MGIDLERLKANLILLSGFITIILAFPEQHVSIGYRQLSGTLHYVARDTSGDWIELRANGDALLRGITKQGVVFHRGLGQWERRHYDGRVDSLSVLSGSCILGLVTTNKFQDLRDDDNCLDEGKRAYRLSPFTPNAWENR